MIGSKHNDDVVMLTLAERQNRFEVLLKIDSKDGQTVTQVIESLVVRSGDHMLSLFKNIRSDNEAEFAELHETLKHVTDVYFARLLRHMSEGPARISISSHAGLLLKASRFHPLVTDRSNDG